jgi:hypothetical protein
LIDLWRKKRPTHHGTINDDELSASGAAIEKAFTSLDEVRLCLTSISVCSPLEEHRWKQYMDEMLEDAANVSAGISFRQIEIIPARLRKSEPLEEEKAASIIGCYFDLPIKYQSRMIRALDRLNQAMRRSSVGDMAVELSIALETLLLGDEKGDNRFKVALRSGIAFSESIEERIKCRKVIKRMYDLRSNLVHQGDDGNSRPENKDDIENAISFTAVIINNLIKKRKEPDWPLLEISGKSLEDI